MLFCFRNVFLTCQVTYDQCSSWFLRMDADTLPTPEVMPSLTAGGIKPGDIVYTPPGMFLVDKVVNEDSLCVWGP